MDVEKHHYVAGEMREPLVQNVCNGNIKGNGANFNKTKLHSKCHLVHHFNPFLNLGPFNIEVMFYKPFRTIIHDFFTETEMDWMMEYSKPRLSASRAGSIPDSTKDLTKSDLRYSAAKRGVSVGKAITAWFNDIVYNESEVYRKISEEGEPLRYEISPLKDPYGYRIIHKTMHEVSRRMEMATNFNVTSRHGASMYQTTNYGLSGMVTLHMDPWGYEMGVLIPDDRYRLTQTGDYIATFMGWFEDTKGGGGTAFTEKDFEGSIEPTKGSAAFWINLSTCHMKDQRASHAGCPVLKGSKWIINKWMFSWDQWKDWPCDMESGTTIPPFQGMSQ